MDKNLDNLKNRIVDLINNTHQQKIVCYVPKDEHITTLHIDTIERCDFTVTTSRVIAMQPEWAWPFDFTPSLVLVYKNCIDGQTLMDKLNLKSPVDVEYFND